MFYLLLAMCFSALVALVLKISANKTKSQYGVVVFNYATCFITGFLLVENKNLLTTEPTTLWLGCGSGLLFLGSLVLYQNSIEKNGAVLSAVFAKLGIIIPILMSFLLFGEMPSWVQIIGIVLAIVAILVMNLRFQGEKSQGQLTTSAFLGLLVMMILGGLTDSTTKIFEFFGNRNEDDRFMFFIFFSAFFYALFFLIREHKPLTRYDVLFGVLLGLPNYLTTRFLLKALVEIPSFVVYPCYSVGTVVIVALIGRIFFREKLSMQQLVGVGIILTALILLNL